MNSKLTELRDRIQRFKVEDHYEPNDQIAMLEILDGIAEELERIENELARTANIASCLANGIQPD